MRSIRRILVAVKDPNRRASPALQKAAQLARGLDVPLELFHALTWPIYAENFPYSDQSFEQVQLQERASALKRLERAAEHIQGRGHSRRLRISVEATWDAPGYEAVIRQALASKADLIVAEAHRGRHLMPHLLHLNDWELLRQSPVPVLLVKRMGSYERPSILAAVDPSHTMDKPARLDASILKLSAAIARACRGRLSAVHAYVPLEGRGLRIPPPDRHAFDTLNTSIALAARKRYEHILTGYAIPKARRHLLSLPAVDAIQRVAADTRSDIVVLGAVSRSGWRRLLIGNTAEALLDRLTCDLLVVKPPHFKTPVKRRVTGAQLAPLLPLVPYS